MTQLRDRPTVPLFNHPERFIPGWYWALPSRELACNQVKAITLLGRDLIVYRSADGTLGASDAYCPHWGTHLGEATLTPEGYLQCPLHHRQFQATGDCVQEPLPRQLKTWPAAEQYGLIWIWTGTTQPQPLPYVPELQNQACDFWLSHHFRRNCHPNVLLINAIDAHHFNSVHNLPLEIHFQAEPLPPSALCLSNTTRGGEASRFVRLIRPLYQEAVTYSMCYWYGSTGTVTLGPDRFHFYLMFALRPLAGGQTEGWTILLTPARKAPWWRWGGNHLVLGITALVANYFAKGDVQVFESIRFDFQTPLPADRAILDFINHVNRQPASAWATWEAL